MVFYFIKGIIQTWNKFKCTMFTNKIYFFSKSYLNFRKNKKNQHFLNEIQNKSITTDFPY